MPRHGIIGAMATRMRLTEAELARLRANDKEPGDTDRWLEATERVMDLSQELLARLADQ